MKIIVDSSCDADFALMERESMELHFIPFSLMLDDEHIIDDESFEINSYIENMRSSKVIRTAAPSPELFLDKLRGEVDSFIITISSPLSASYSNASIAKQMYEDEGGKCKVHIFDSRSTSMGPVLIAMKINELMKSKFGFDEIVKSANDFIESMSTYFVLERYDNLVKNGRINSYVAKVASMLNIKPVCAEVDGKLAMIDKAMGSNKALMKIVDKVIKDTVDFEKRILGISHVRCIDKALWIKDEILKKIKFKDVIILETNGLNTTYADDGGIILSY